jgi:hypothetical protein
MEGWRQLTVAVAEPLRLDVTVTVAGFVATEAVNE